MDATDLAELLEARRYGEARRAAEELLRQGRQLPLLQAQAYLVLSRSLAALHEHQEALGPAELAVHYSRQTSDHDLTGKALCHLAELCADAGLHKRALACLEEFFRQMPLFDKARTLEGWAFRQAAICHRGMWRESRAADYLRKAYRWHLRHARPAEEAERIRAELTWQSLRIGQIQQALPLLAESEQYVAQSPHDWGARVDLQNNLAYKAYLEGAHGTACALALAASRLNGAGAGQKAYSYLILHYAAKAGARPHDALGFGLMARIQAMMARRTDLERELTRSLLGMQERAGLPAWRPAAGGEQEHSRN